MSRADHVRLLLLTGFGTGRAPIASGTFGTLPGVAIAVVLGFVLPGSWFVPAVLGLAAVLFLFGVAQTAFVARVFGVEDPGAVVLDEIVGYLVTIGGFALVAGIPDVWAHVAGFFAFRVFDVWKPPPVGALEDLPGALGIMADDVAAGVYAALVLIALHALGLI